MRNLLLALLLFSLNLSAQSTNFKSEFIYETAPFPSCHASTIAETPQGLISAWFGGTHERHKDVGIWTSRLVDGKWTAPVEVANGVQTETLRYPCWNPVLFKTKEGKLFLFYKVGKNPREWWGMMKYSDDDAKTWSKPGKLPENILGAIKNKPIQLQNGDLLHPSSTESVGENTWHIHLEKCDKNGQNWVKIPIENDTFGVIQPTILRYSKNKLQLLNRSRHNKVVQTWSSDNGKTWSPLSVTNLPNPNSGVDGVTLKNGWQALVYNPMNAGENWSDGRKKLSLAISKDGTNWKDIYTFEDEKTGEFSYPAIIQSADGLVHITYTSNRKNIKYVILKVDFN